MFVLILIILAILIGIYIFIVVKFNDLTFPTLNIENKKNVLVIYPHPDDEAGMSCGLIYQLANKNDINLYVISTTKGEHGDELYKLSPKELAKVRSEEFRKVMQVLKVKNYGLWNFTDGSMPDQENEIKERIKKFIDKYSINLVVTYERAGLYGHPDHIVLSKIVNDLQNEEKFDVLYSTLPDKILKRIKLPKTLTYKNRVVPLTLETIADPEYKLNITKHLIKRYLAIRQYKSQNVTQGKPLWMVNMLANYEYYTSKYE